METDQEENVKEQPLVDRRTPKDNWNIVLLLFLVLGISGLLPWNLFITAHQYFFVKLGDNNNETGKNNYLQENFESYFVVTGSLSAVIGNILNVILANKFSGDFRVILGHLLVFFSLVATFVLAFLDTERWRLTFFISTLFILVIGQVGCSGFLCGGSAGLAALFPPKYMKAFIIGQAVCGVCISIVSILSLSFSSGSALNAGRIYFGVSILFTILSFTAYYPSRFNSFVKFYTTRKRTFSTNVADEDFEPLLSNSVAADVKITTISINKKLVLLKTFYHGSLIMLVFSVTLSCFPALMSKVISSSVNQNWQKYFIAVCCFLIVNFFDFTSRLLTTCISWPSSRSSLLTLLCLIRVGFIFLFLLCNYSSKTYFPTIFYSDWWFVIFASLLGFSNGYLCNLLCAYLPQRLPAEEKETAGTLLSAYINMGVFIGSCLSFGVIKLL